MNFLSFLETIGQLVSVRKHTKASFVRSRSPSASSFRTTVKMATVMTAASANAFQVSPAPPAKSTLMIASEMAA